MEAKRMLNAFIGFIVVIGATNGWAFDRYVSSSGNDFNLCTNPSYPCRTIQHAVDLAADGETIKVAEGVYDEQILITESVSGLVIEGGWNSDFTSKSDDRSKSVVRSLSGAAHRVFEVNPDPQQDIEVTIRNFTIISGDQKVGIQVVISHSLTTANVTIEHNTIRENDTNVNHSPGLSIYAGTGSTETVIIKDNIIENNLNTDILASAYGWSNVSIELYSNLIKDYNSVAHAIGLSCNNSTLYLNSVNNIMASDGPSLFNIAAENHGHLVFYSTNDTIVQNINGWYDIPVKVYGSSLGLMEMTMFNSIIWNDDDQDIGSKEVIRANGACGGDPILRPSGSITINDSDIGGTINVMGCWSDLPVAEAGNINANPKLNSAFHLAGSSPCRNSGLCGFYALGAYFRIAPYSDIDGDDRPPFGVLSGCDMGADEFVVKSMPWLSLLTN